MYAIVLNQIRHTEINFPAELLPEKMAKYGANLRVVGGNAALVPAAPSIAKPTLGRLEGLGSQRPEKITKERRKLGTVNKNAAKPIICTTTATYYPAAHLAAKDMNCSGTAISLLLKGQRSPINGHEFRFATKEEITAQMALCEPTAIVITSGPLSSKPVVNEDTGEYFHSVAAVARATGICPKNVVSHLNKKRQHSGIKSLRWASKEEKAQQLMLQF